MSKFSERDRDNLSAILDYCDRVEAIYQQMGHSYDMFLKDQLYRDAFMMNILQIGEAANRLSDECREILHELPWREIVGTRNIIVHGYTQVNDEIMWNVITNDVPELKKKVGKVIS